MGRVFTATNSNSVDRGVRKKTIGREIVIGPNAIKFVAITIFAILGMVYLAQSTSGANRSVKVQDLTDQKNQLQLEQERLQVEQTRLQSLKTIDSGITQPNQQVVLQPAAAVQHLQN